MYGRSRGKEKANKTGSGDKDEEEEIVFPKIIEIDMNDNVKFNVKEYRDALYNKIRK